MAGHLTGLLAAAMAAGAAGGDSADVAALAHLWAGVRDSSEQVVMSLDAGSTAWPLSSERRVRTVVAPVNIAWLGEHVLYLEEFLQDDAEHPRRQLLLQLEPAREPPHAVRVHLFTFADPPRWVHLNYRPGLLASLVWRDVLPAAGCDL